MLPRLIFLIITTCFLGNSCQENEEKHLGNNKEQVNKKDLQELRNAFLSSQLQSNLFYSSGKKKYFAPVTVNTELSQVYGGGYPNVTFMADYNAEFGAYLAANIGGGFHENLPKKIQDELKNRNINLKNIDIYWLVQPRGTMGEKTQGVTLLKAHTWADPHMPNKFKGTRLNQDFLYGIFNPGTPLSNEIQENKMTAIPVHIHDGVLSPNSGKIKLPNEDKTFSFWSLVIGKRKDEQHDSAIATLHWVIANKDKEKFLREFLQSLPKNYHIVPAQMTPKYNTIGDYIHMLKSSSFLKDTSEVKKLTDVIF